MLSNTNDEFNNSLALLGLKLVIILCASSPAIRTERCSRNRKGPKDLSEPRCDDLVRLRLALYPQSAGFHARMRRIVKLTRGPHGQGSWQAGNNGHTCRPGPRPDPPETNPECCPSRHR